VRGILDDFLAGGRSERGLVDVIDECRTYLAEPLRQSLAPPPQLLPNLPPEPAAVAPPGADATGLAPPGADATALAAAPAAVGGPAFDDGPEELEIPADKLGLTSDFCEESRENLAQVGHRLVQLEEADDPLDIVNDLFRSVHTVKGGARLLRVRK